jgi:hypothetical protein
MDQNIFDAGTQGFNLPHDIVQLPSQGVFYKTKKKAVKVGYLTANDENFIISSFQGNKDNIIITLLRNKLYEHDLRPEELIDGDVEAILIYLRNTSFGPEYQIEIIDPKTGKPFTYTEILDELNLKKTTHSPDEDGLFTVTLPKSGSVVKLRLLNLGDSLEIDRLSDSYPVGRVAPKITWRLQKQIVEVNGNTTLGDISVFIDTLPIMDSKFIRNFLRENQPSLDLRRTAIAPSGELVPFEVSFGVDFFRPFF